MATLDFKSLCPCGTEIKGKAKLPTLITNAVSKAQCPNCGTKILITLKRDRTQSRGRTFTTDLEFLELTAKAQKIMAAKLHAVAKVAVAKVQKAIGLEPNLDTGVVETDLDKS